MTDRQEVRVIAALTPEATAPDRLARFKSNR